MSSTPHKYLLPTERRVVEVRRHPAMLFWPLVQTAIVIAVALVLSYLVRHNSLVQEIVGGLAILALLRLAYLFGDWWVERFVVTDQRVLLSSGLLTRRVAMMPLRKVTDMTYERSVLGRLLGYGEFIMESAGQDQALSRVPYLPRPDSLYLEVSQLLFGRGAVHDQYSD
ncbi:MAG TPA: PH domain-containing protein [Mycobacteriales bacterium]|jgi:uncharacterized membrane protein YdbT with pleckstrin-like domain